MRTPLLITISLVSGWACANGTDAAPGYTETTASGVLFQSERDGSGEIYYIRKDGFELHRLTRDTFYDDWPAPSPDGSRVAYSSIRGGFYHICLMNIDGSQQNCITRDSANDIQPAWSPDGRALVFIRYLTAINNHAALWLVDSSGTGLRLLRSADQHESFSDPQFNPQGTRIVATLSRFDEPDLVFVDPTTGDTSPFIMTPAREYAAAWSPDGQLLAFNSFSAGNNLAVADQTGAHPHLTRFPEYWERFSWSPDGAELAVGCYIGLPKLCRMNSAADSVILIPGVPLPASKPRWIQ